jgi:LCP family protein required for cell wall assembly
VKLTNILRTLVVAVVVAVVGGAAASAWFVRGAGAVAFTVTKTAAASQQWSPDRPMFILLLGSDMRPGAGCGCSDAIHLLGVPAGGGRASIVNIPRDMRIDIPGYGLGKITEAMSKGGPQLTTQAISQWTGVPIDYTIVTSFDGLTGMIDDLGGVVVNVATPVHDSLTNVDVDPGPVAMNGDLALRYARSRHIDGGDFTRTQDQAAVILAVLAKVRGDGTSPADTIRYLGIMARRTQLSGLSTPELYRLARAGLRVSPAAVRSVLVPSHGALIGGTSYVVPDAPAQGLFADLRDDAVLQTH